MCDGGRGEGRAVGVAEGERVALEHQPRGEAVASRVGVGPEVVLVVVLGRGGEGQTLAVALADGREAQRLALRGRGEGIK